MAPTRDLEALGPDAVARVVTRDYPALSGAPVVPVMSSGTEHLAFRIGAHHLARFPRDGESAQSLAKEIEWLPRLAGRLPLAVPELVHVGSVGSEPDLPWLLTRWIEGSDAASAVLAGRGGHSWPDVLADTVLALREVDLQSVPQSAWPEGQRGGHLRDRLEDLDDRDDDVAGPLDPAPVLGLLSEALRDEPRTAGPVLLHADLIPGNLIVREGRLVGLVDLGALTTGRPEWDLTPAWWVLDEPGRARFRRALAVDDCSWAWGRAFAAVQALLAQWYYRPRGHGLAPLASRALREAVAGWAADR